MTKLEYLKQLEDALKNRMSRKDIDDIIRDYAEYFAEGSAKEKANLKPPAAWAPPKR